MHANAEYFLTQDAADYCRLNGRPASASLLRKIRLKGPDDPGDAGPAWVRAPNGYAMYPRAGLDAWIASYRESLKPRERIPAPERLRAQAA